MQTAHDLLAAENYQNQLGVKGNIRNTSTSGKMFCTLEMDKCFTDIVLIYFLLIFDSTVAVRMDRCCAHTVEVLLNAIFFVMNIFILVSTLDAIKPNNNNK